ncbi:MFS transporter [Aromatoleum diolicum]|nr:MFS transporter [Aromatoleum diolicum]
MEGRLIAVLRAAHMTHLIDFMIMMPLGAYFIRSLGAAPSDLGRLVFAYTVSAGVSGVLVSGVIDRFDRRSVLLAGYGGFTTSLLLTAFAPSLDALVGARIVAGVTGGVLSAMIQAMVVEVVPPSLRASAIGRVTTGHALAAVIGVPAGLALASALDWRSSFLAVWGLALFVLVGIRRHVPSLPGKTVVGAQGAAPRRPGASLVELRSLAGFLLTFAVTFSAYAVIAYIAPYWVGNVGVAEAWLPLVYLLAGAMSLHTSPLAGRLADRHGRFGVFALATLLSVVGIVLATHAPRLPLVPALALGGGFFVFIYARWVPCVAMLSDVPPPASRGAFLMLNGVTTQLGMGAGAIFSGSVIELEAGGRLSGFDTIGLVAAAISLAAIALARFITRSG